MLVNWLPAASRLITDACSHSRVIMKIVIKTKILEHWTMWGHIVQKKPLTCQCQKRSVLCEIDKCVIQWYHEWYRPTLWHMSLSRDVLVWRVTTTQDNGSHTFTGGLRSGLSSPLWLAAKHVMSSHAVVLLNLRWGICYGLLVKFLCTRFFVIRTSQSWSKPSCS